MKIIKNLLLIVVVLFGMLLVFSPSIGETDIYLSAKDKKYFLSLVQKNNKKAIENMFVYYKKKKEKRNLYYLKCFLRSNNYIKNVKGIDINKCPKNALSLIKNDDEIYNYLEYKLSSIFRKGTVFLIRDKNNIKYEE